MGVIMSGQAAIDRIHWVRPKAGRPFKVERAVLVPKAGHHHNEDLLVMKLEGGGFACSRDLSKFAYAPGDYPWNTPVMTALVALGAISQKDMDRHLEGVRQRTERQRREYQADSLWRTLKEAGLEPTPEQYQFCLSNASDRFIRENGLPERTKT